MCVWHVFKAREDAAAKLYIDIDGYLVNVRGHVHGYIFLNDTKTVLINRGEIIRKLGTKYTCTPNVLHAAIYTNLFYFLIPLIKEIRKEKKVY